MKAIRLITWSLGAFGVGVNVTLTAFLLVPIPNRDHASQSFAAVITSQYTLVAYAESGLVRYLFGQHQRRELLLLTACALVIGAGLFLWSRKKVSVWVPATWILVSYVTLITAPSRCPKLTMIPEEPCPPGMHHVRDSRWFVQAFVIQLVILIAGLAWARRKTRRQSVVPVP